MWDKVIYFIVDYILGFVFQTAGISLCIFAYTRVKFDKIKYIIMTLSITVISIILRFAKPYLGPAFVIIGTSLFYILITVFLLKQSFLSSAIAALISYGSVMVLEAIFGALVWPLVFGEVKAEELFLNQSTLEFKLLGLPINLILLTIGLIFYFVLKREKHGENGEKAG